jgi:hypothetical protein
MSDYIDDKTKARIQEALKVTQEQTEEAAQQLGAFLRVGAKRLREAAGQVKQAIQNDIDSRP